MELVARSEYRQSCSLQVLFVLDIKFGDIRRFSVQRITTNERVIPNLKLNMMPQQPTYTAHEHYSNTSTVANEVTNNPNGADGRQRQRYSILCINRKRKSMLREHWALAIC